MVRGYGISLTELWGKIFVRKSYEAQGPQQTEQQNVKLGKKVWHKRCCVVQLISGSTGLYWWNEMIAYVGMIGWHEI